MNSMTTKRKAISKKLRFDVFKRDAFTCQYCGAHPPAVVLEPDHINPVANGGGNEMDNLVTACFDCNRGKSATLLSSVPQSLADKAADIAERELQIIGYQKVMNSRQMRIEGEVTEVCAIYESFTPGFTLTAAALASVRRFIEGLGVHAVLGAMEEAHTRRTVQPGNEFKYFCGICWNLVRSQSNGPRA